MQIIPPDIRAAVFSPGTGLEIKLRLPDARADALIARFQLPSDGAALQSMMDPCFQFLDEEARKEQAARVVSCPAVPGKTLRGVDVLVGPTMKKLDPDPDNDVGIAWDLPKKTKAHPVAPKATLACYYGPEGSTDAGPALEKRLLPIPATAKYCVFRKDGHCSTAEGTQ